MKHLLTTILLLISFIGSAQNGIGKWSGKLNLNASVSLKLIIEVSQNSNDYSAKLISIDQGNATIPANSASINGNNISLEFSAIGAKYNATINDSTLNGTFTQSGQKFSLNMNKLSTEEINNSLKRPQTPVEPYPYKQEEVVFTNRIEGNKLSGTLTTPKNGVKCDAVVLISGSGAQNRDEELFGHKPFLVLSDHLTRAGIAVLRYDDRGVGKSEKIETPATTLNLAYDAEAAINYLRNSGKFNRVGVIGHSEGGIIAFILAGDNNYSHPDYIISMAGTGVIGHKVLLGQQKLALKNAGLSANKIEEAISINGEIFSQITQSKEVNPELISSISEIIKKHSNGIDDKTLESNTKKIIATFTSPWMYFFIKYNPQEIICKTTCPVFAINGTLDNQVIAEENITAIESALNEGGNSYYSIKRYQNLNHLFQKCKTGAVPEYSQIQETINPEVLQDITEWILGL